MLTLSVGLDNKIGDPASIYIYYSDVWMLVSSSVLTHHAHVLYDNNITDILKSCYIISHYLD